MQTGRQWITAAAMAASLIGFGAVSAQDGRRAVEVTIKDFTFKVEAGTLQLHEPVRIVLTNTDSVQHGFTSDVLDGLDVRVESEGVVTYGRGIKGLYIDPGNQVELLFTPTKSGPVAFRCDLHPRMKGELVVLSVGAA
jgi:hypothetical protein